MYILGALNKETNQYVLPNKAEKNVEYICIDCKQKVIFHKGEVRVAHFAHYSPTNTCSYYEHPNESQLHKDAKYKVADWLKNKMKMKIGFQCPKCTITPSQDDIDIEYTENDEVIVEYRGPNGIYVADVALINDNKVRYIFEIKHTHATLTECRPEPWFEFSTEQIFETEKLYNNKEFDYLMLGCERKSKNRYCNSCKVGNEKWGENLPRLNQKGGQGVGWKQENPCIVCKRNSYNPVFAKGFRQICKICLDQNYDELKEKYDISSKCLFADDD